MAFISKIKLPGSETSYLIKDLALTNRVDLLEQTVSSALVFKGVVGDAAGITGLSDYKKGWCYKSSGSFDFGTEHVTPGDMLICVSSKDGEFKYSDWTILEETLDDFQGATQSAAGARGLVPAPAAGAQNSVLCGDATWIDTLVLDCGTSEINI